MTLSIVSGAAAELVTYADAIALTRILFAAFDRGEAVTFPSIRGHGSRMTTRFGVKAAYDGLNNMPGVKIGSYWPSNAAHGLANHGSTTILLDDETGFPLALVEASWLNGLRTAASDALAVDLLARPDATVLAIFGTGAQAYHEARAIMLVRQITEVVIVGRNGANARRLADRLVAEGVQAAVSDMLSALRRADILVTVTAARGALFAAELVMPGTHISAMGADGPGKQELPQALAGHARLFADSPAQSLEIGEFQYLAGTGQGEAIVGIGAVLNGNAVGRPDAEAITIYDSSGIGLQDLAIAAFALERAREAGLVTEVAF